MKYDYMKLIEIIKNKRIEKGLSMRKLGVEAGVSHTEISKIENGIRPTFSFYILAKICEVLDIDIVNLMEDVGLLKEKKEKLFYVMFKNDEEYVFKVHAIDEMTAAKIALDFVTENGIIDFGNKHKNTLLAIVDNPYEFNKVILNNYDKTGKLIADKNLNFDEEDNFFCPYCDNDVFLD